MWRAIGSFGVAMVLMLTATNAFAEKVNWNDFVEKQPTTYTQIGKDAKAAKAQPAKAQPAPTRTVQAKANTRAVAKAPAKAAPKAKAKAPVRKK